MCNATRIAVEEIKWKVEGAPAGYRFHEGHNATTIMIFYLSQPFVLSTAIIFASCRACNFFRMSRRGFSCLFPSRSMHVNSRFSHRSISASFPQLYQCRSSCEISVERRGRVSYADVCGNIVARLRDRPRRKVVFSIACPLIDISFDILMQNSIHATFNFL